MKYFSRQPILLALILNFFIPLILFVLVSAFLVIFVLNQNTSFSIIQNFHNEKIISPPPPINLLTKQVIKGQIKASDNNLGIIAIPFTIHNKTNGKTVFRIKKVGEEKWYYMQAYENKKFEGYNYFPFGFPIIKDSLDKNFYFELELISTEKNTPTILEKESPQIITRYLYSKNYLINNPSTIIPFFLKKALFALHSATNLVMFFALNSIMLIVYFFLIKFPRTSNRIHQLFVTKENRKKISLNIFLKKNKHLIIILSLGMLLRIILALNANYNFDMKNFITDAEIFRLGKTNIYLYQQSYNYSPILFYLIGFVDTIQRIISDIPFYVLFRIFISSVDIGSALLLYKIAKILKISPLKTVTLFFLNPVSIILSGFHAQFDNIAVFFLLLSIFIYCKNPVFKKSKRILLWTIGTIGFITKHIIFAQTFLLYTYLFKDKKLIKASFLFFISLTIFFVTFIPYYSEASDTIIKNVFQYSGLARLTGFSYIISELCNNCKVLNIEIYDVYKYIFLCTSFLFALYAARLPIIRSMLVTTLFFLTFSSSIAAQYFILPIAFGAFFPTKWFYLYSAIVTIFLLGNSAELNISAFNLVTVSTAWLFSLLWFTSEFFILFRSKKNR